MKKLIDYLSAESKISNKVLLEKDIILHKILYELLQDEFFASHFVFKGGTCLTKCYLGYYRFSEDLDFTWADQKLFAKKSQKKIRKLLSDYIHKVLDALVASARKLKIDFTADKGNKRYVELGGSNKFSTFKFWYRSEILQEEQFVKIQINFLEQFYYPFRKCRAKSIVAGVNKKEFTFLFPEEAVLLLQPEVQCYALKEILLEKFRAILTRRGVKARDFIDIFIIAQRGKINPRTLRKNIIAKTRFMLRYDKYLQNLRDFRLEEFMIGEEEKLLLSELPEGFTPFLREIQLFIGDLWKELQP